MFKKINLIFFCLVILLAGMLLSSCALPQEVKNAPNTNQTENSNVPLIGGQKDAHGCLIAAGYSWCEQKNKCLRNWEEVCDPQTQAAIQKLIAVGLKKPIENVKIIVTQSDETHAVGSISSSVEPQAEGGLFVAAKIDGNWKILYSGNGSVNCVELGKYNFSKEMLTGICD